MTGVDYSINYMYDRLDVEIPIPTFCCDNLEVCTFILDYILFLMIVSQLERQFTSI